MHSKNQLDIKLKCFLLGSKSHQNNNQKKEKGRSWAFFQISNQGKSLKLWVVPSFWAMP